MGCCNSKGKQPTDVQSQEKPVKEEPEAAAVPKAAEPAPEEHKKEETCKSCSNTGKDFLGKRCTCAHGKAFKRPSVPLKVTIVSARGLRNADWVGKSDPYCICEVSGKSGSKTETKVVMDNLSPEWNHEAVLTGYCAGDELRFIVKDKDPLKSDDALGSVTLATEELIATGFEGELALTGTGASNTAHLKIKVSIVHPVLKVTVISASGLRNADWVGKSDPYCICEVQGKPHVKFQTPVIDEQLSPEWHHTATVPGYCVEDPLTFTVKDKDTLKPDDYLGTVTLSSDQFLETGFDGELPLSNAGKGIEAFLTIKIVVNPEPVEEVVEEKKTAATPVAPPPDPVKAVPVVESTVAPKGLCC